LIDTGNLSSKASLRLLFGLREQRLEIERAGEHPDALAVGWARPVLEWPVPVELDAVPVEMRDRS